MTFFYWCKLFSSSIKMDNLAPHSKDYILKNLGIIFDICANKDGNWLCWIPPYGGWCKLNTDGPCIDGQCTGGGVLRDCMCNVILAMSFSLGFGNNAFAESASFLFCFQICLDNNFYPNIVELDSQFLVDCLKGDILSLLGS